jgi:hypothetical protein
MSNKKIPLKSLPANGDFQIKLYFILKQKKGEIKHGKFKANIS